MSPPKARPNFAPGAFGDVFVGLNAPISDSFVVGVQADGAIGATNFGSQGTRSYVFSDASGPTGSGTGSFDQKVSSPWMVTGLLRGGYLLNPATLVYGVAGWTAAQFNIP